MSTYRTDEPEFVVQWTDHTDGRRYLSIVPQFAMADLTADDRETYIRLWDALEPTPSRPGALLLVEPFDQLVDPGETVAMDVFVGRLREFADGRLAAARKLRSSMIEAFGPTMRSLAEACQPLADWRRETVETFVDGEGE